jgi:ketosteroid isomerase-like protein
MRVQWTRAARFARQRSPLTRRRLAARRNGRLAQEGRMSIAAALLQRHIETLVDDHQRWQGLIADNIVWELAYAPAIGHPAKLSGRDEVLHHVRWFLGAVEHFRFIDPQVYAFTDPQAAVAQVKAEALIKPTGRIYRQEYVVFLRAAGDKIVYLREYFDPTRAAKSMDATILDLEPWF